MGLHNGFIGKSPPDFYSGRIAFLILKKFEHCLKDFLMLLPVPKSSFYLPVLTLFFFWSTEDFFHQENQPISIHNDVSLSQGINIYIYLFLINNLLMTISQNYFQTSLGFQNFQANGRSQAKVSFEIKTQFHWDPLWKGWHAKYAAECIPPPDK